MPAKKLIQEPLLHFFALGGALFLLYAALNDDRTAADDEIVITGERLASITATFEKTWQRAPTEEELQGLLESWVREEILYREGLSIGFDQNDQVIRRRVAQKMSFVADGLVPDVPDDAALREYLEANRDDYRIPPIFTFSQLYIDPRRHAADLENVLASTGAALEDDSGEVPAGDSTLLPANLERASAREVERVFGKEFATALRDVEVGSWQGPLRSGYGLHFVKIIKHVAARDPELDDVRASVERDYLNAQSREMSEAFYQSLRERYTVRNETPAEGD